MIGSYEGYFCNTFYYMIVVCEFLHSGQIPLLALTFPGEWRKSLWSMFTLVWYRDDLRDREVSSKLTWHRSVTVWIDPNAVWILEMAPKHGCAHMSKNAKIISLSHCACDKKKHHWPRSLEAKSDYDPNFGHSSQSTCEMVFEITGSHALSKDRGCIWALTISLELLLLSSTDLGSILTSRVARVELVLSLRPVGFPPDDLVFPCIPSC